MARPSEDDREAVDRAFAELVAGYHLTAERPQPPERTEDPGQTASVTAAPVEPHRDPPAVDTTWADAHPLFSFTERVPEPDPESAEASVGYQPDPLPPLPRPGVPALVGWIGIAYAVFVVLAGTFGVTFPTWAGWLAIGGFLGGFAILMTRLPRHRPPDAGDGAVL